MQELVTPNGWLDVGLMYLSPMEILLLLLVVPLIPFYIISTVVSAWIFILGIPFIALATLWVFFYGFFTAILSRYVTPNVHRYRAILKEMRRTGNFATTIPEPPNGEPREEGRCETSSIFDYLTQSALSSTLSKYLPFFSSKMTTPSTTPIPVQTVQLSEEPCEILELQESLTISEFNGECVQEELPSYEDLVEALTEADMERERQTSAMLLAQMAQPIPTARDSPF